MMGIQHVAVGVDNVDVIGLTFGLSLVSCMWVLLVDLTVRATGNPSAVTQVIAIFLIAMSNSERTVRVIGGNEHQRGLVASAARAVEPPVDMPFVLERAAGDDVVLRAAFVAEQMSHVFVVVTAVPERIQLVTDNFGTSDAVIPHDLVVSGMDSGIVVTVVCSE